MLKQVYDVDDNGYIIDIYVTSIDEYGNILDVDKKNMIKVDYPPLHVPKWTGLEWVEGESDIERTAREAVQQLESFIPSSDEIADAELEIKMITLLNELGVIV